MLVAEKYRLHRQIGWSDEAEVHSGPPDPTHGGVPLAVKIRHGIGGPRQPDSNCALFLRAAEEQKAAVAAGCRQVAPIFESGYEGDNAYYVTQHYPRSLDSLIQGRVNLDASALHQLVRGVLGALEEVRDRASRPHGNFKPTNVFLDGKTVRGSSVVLGDFALRESVTGGEGADCYGLGASIYQLVRGRSIRNFDWPIMPSDDWQKLGPQANAWREFCNVLMSPETGANPAALVAARGAFKNMRRLGAAAAKSSRANDQPDGQKETTAETRAPVSKGVLAGIGAGLAAVVGLGTVCWQPADSKLGRQFRSISALAPLLRMVDGPARQLASSVSTSSSASGAETQNEALAAAETPAGSPAGAGKAGAESGAVAAAETPVVAVATPPPTPVPENPGDKWIGYTAVLQRFQQELRDPAAADQPDLLTNNLTRLKDGIIYSPVKDEPAVVAFLNVLPKKIEASGDQPDLPAALWKKDSVVRQDDVQSVVYQWGSSGFRFAFVRVPGSNGAAFYLSATTVPVQFGVALAMMAEKDGKGPLSGAASVKGPVSWEYAGGRYGLRNSWLVLDSVNDAVNKAYQNRGRPAADSPMNGLSAIEAVRLARAAGCALPTLDQWRATLASPGGQRWAADWQSTAKVRNPEWSAFAKSIEAMHVTGAKLPNDQCFGDRTDLSPVGTGSDTNLFFEGVGTRSVGGFAHLIGNIGQYVVDDARNPTKFYFAGGSAEAAPAVFQSLTSPPLVASSFLAWADGGLRLAIAAKGNGNEKNTALEELKVNLDKELARVKKLQ